MITADLHTHTSFSTDSDAPLEKMAQAALEKGLKTICFTEHMDFDYPGGEFFLDTAAYRKELFRVKELYRGSLEILFGVELGLMDYIAPTLKKYSESFDFDFIIGSAHQVDGIDPYYPEYFNTHGDRKGIYHFYESALAAVRAFGNFDVFGHFDYIVRYTHAKSYSPADFADIVDEILKELISRGRGLEINTAGIHYGLGWAHPHPDVLKRYRELGGEIITVGSDAHSGDRVAYCFETTQEMLRAAGFRYRAVFRGRKPEFVPL